MITLVLLGLLGGSGWFGVRQFKRARRAEAKLERIAASSDDEVIAVLEASSSPMAERLLLEARAESGRTLSAHGWKALLADLRSHDDHAGRFQTLCEYVNSGLLVTEKQYLSLVKMFDSGVARDNVCYLLKTRRTERRRQG